MNNNKCLICKNKSFKKLANFENFPVFFGIVPKNVGINFKCYPLIVSSCNNCGLIQQVGSYDENIQKEVNNSDYYYSPSPKISGLGTREIDKFLSFFLKCNISKGKILEIACFDGYLLEKLQEHKWEVFGCDPSFTTKMAIKNIGESHIKNDYFSSDLYPSGYFDVIVFRNLLEHIYDLNSFLGEVIKCLKPEGHIFVDVPNAEIILKQGFGSFFHQHVSYFTIDTLSYLLSLNNFSVENKLEGNPNIFVLAKKNNNNIYSYDTQKIQNNINKYINVNVQLKKLILNLFKNNNNIALFGASALSTTIINILNEKDINKIKWVIDNDPFKYGKKLYGCDIEIKSIDVLKNKQLDIVIVASYIFAEEIKNQLLNNGIKSNKIITFHDEN